MPVQGKTKIYNWSSSKDVCGDERVRSRSSSLETPLRRRTADDIVGLYGRELIRRSGTEGSNTNWVDLGCPWTSQPWMMKLLMNARTIEQTDPRDLDHGFLGSPTWPLGLMIFSLQYSHSFSLNLATDSLVWRRRSRHSILSAVRYCVTHNALL